MTSTPLENELNVIQPDDGYQQLNLHKEKSEILTTTNPFEVQGSVCKMPLSPQPMVHKSLSPPKINCKAHTNSPDISLICQRNDPMKNKLKQMNQNAVARGIISHVEIKDESSFATKETAISRKKDSLNSLDVPVIFKSMNDDFILPYEMELQSSRQKPCYSSKACCIMF
jgi:hypothetical protein